MLNNSHQTMSRQAQLPPRCPFQRKPISSPTNPTIHSYFPRHHKSPSQGSILEDQPAWLDDLLNDQEAISKPGGTHRRSSSDSVVDILPSLNLKQNPIPARSESQGVLELELDCTYGPNSPRARTESAAFSDNGIVSALSKYISQNPLQVLDGSLCISSDSRSDVHGFDGDHDTEMKPKRHSGQRSRVRKLQYIAELEKTVEVFQVLNVTDEKHAVKAFESELAVKVAALLQQRVTLTMENAKLKQKMTRLRQEKLFMEGQYQSLRKEADRLRANLARSPNRHARSYSDTSIAARAGIGGEAAWHTSLGLDKLNLNNN